MLAFVVWFSCVLCNINARFAPISYKKALITHLIMYYMIRRKIKQSNGRNQMKRKLMSCISSPLQSPIKQKGSLEFAVGKIPFAAAKRFAIKKLSFTTMEEGHNRRKISSSSRRRSLCHGEGRRARPTYNDF